MFGTSDWWNDRLGHIGMLYDTVHVLCNAMLMLVHRSVEMCNSADKVLYTTVVYYAMST